MCLGSAPAVFEGSKTDMLWLFRRRDRGLGRRLGLSAGLQLYSLDALSLRSQLNDFGKTETLVGENT